MPQLLVAEVSNPQSAKSVEVPITINVDVADKTRVGAIGVDILHHDSEMSIVRVVTPQPNHRAFLFSPRTPAPPPGLFRRRIGVFPDFRTPIPAMDPALPVAVCLVDLGAVKNGDRVILNAERIQIAATNSEVLCGPGALASRPKVCGHIDGLINVGFDPTQVAGFETIEEMAVEEAVTLADVMQMIKKMQSQQ